MVQREMATAATLQFRYDEQLISGNAELPVLGNGFARVGMMPSGLADRIAN